MLRFAPIAKDRNKGLEVMSMCRRLGCFLFTVLFGITIFVAWWFHSPRRDLSTPAKQGALTLRAAYVAEDNLFNSSAFCPVKNIVLEFQVQANVTTAQTYSVPLRVVTSDGATELVEGYEVWNLGTPQGFWARIWHFILSYIRSSGNAPPTIRACIPVAYSSSARYLDVYADSPAADGSRWRLVNLPRALHAITPPVQIANTYRCEDFLIHARAKQQPVSAGSADGPSVIELALDTQVNHPPSPNFMLYVALKSVTPEWAPGSSIQIKENEFVSVDVVTAHTARTVYLLRLPFAQNQRYVRVECEGWLARHQTDMRLLRLPLRKITTVNGKRLSVIAPQRQLAVNLLGGTVKIPGEKELPQLPKVQSVSPSSHNVFFFYQRDVRDPPELHSLDVVVVLPAPGKSGKSFVTQSEPGGVERLVVTLPHGKPAPRESMVYLWGRG